MKINKPKHKLTYIVILVVLLIVALSGVGVWYYLNHNQKKSDTSVVKQTKTNTVVAPDKPKASPMIHMAAMGDMLAHDTIIANAKTGDTYDFTKYFANIRSVYKSADVVFCNQEGLSAGDQYGISGYPSFNAPTKFSADLQSGAGCNVINLANNHMGDKGVNATNVTIDNWNALKPLAISGANKSSTDQEKVSFAEVNKMFPRCKSKSKFSKKKKSKIFCLRSTGYR